MSNKKILSYLACAALSTAALASCSSKDEDTITVGTNAEFAPFEYQAEDGSLTGIDMDIIRAYGEYAGKKIDIQNMDFDAALTSVSTGKLDLAIAGITRNEARNKIYDFTDSYYTANQVVIVKEGESMSDLETVEEIRAYMSKISAKIGVQRGTTGQYYAEGDADWGFDAIEGTTCQTYDNGGLAVNDLINGRVDCVIIDSAPAEKLCEKFSGVKVLPASLTEEEYAIAVTKGNTALVDSLNEFIKKIKEDGTFATIVAKYYDAK